MSINDVSVKTRLYANAAAGEREVEGWRIEGDEGERGGYEKWR